VCLLGFVVVTDCEVRSLVTLIAKGDEVFLCIVTEQTARLYVMNPEIT
jgi:hypothetical protein